MSNSQDAGTREALRLETIRSLTSLARATYDTDHGTHPVDFADLLAGILSTVAANVGGVGALLAGRDGSWEADLVAQLVYGTAGHDEQNLAERRTEPITCWFWPEEMLEEAGIAAQWEKEADIVHAAVEAAYDAASVRLADHPVVARANAAPTVDVNLRERPPTDEEERILVLYDAKWAVLRAEDAELQAARAALAELLESQEREATQYAAALLQAAQDKAHRLGWRAPVVAGELGAWVPDRDDWQARQLEEHARAAVPAPTGP